MLQCAMDHCRQSQRLVRDGRPVASGVWAAAVVAAASWAYGCSGGDDANKFSLGETNVVDVSGQTAVTEPLSGLVFRFPDAGAGTLKLTAIVEAPARPFSGGSGWAIEYQGQSPVVLVVPPNETEESSVYGFGVHLGSVDDGGNAAGRWVPVAGDEISAGTFEYELPLAAAASSAAGQSPSPDRSARVRAGGRGYAGFSNYWIRQVKPTSDETERRNMTNLQMLDYIDAWIGALPAALSASARAEVDGRLKLRRYYDGNYYIGFTRRLLIGNSTTAMLGLTTTADAQVIAHEVGHYMNHVLAGDSAYLAIEDTTPDENHGLGDVHEGRSVIVEDYAYFSQYFLTGSVGAGDPAAGPRSLIGSADPKRDMPSVEGFGCLLLAALVRPEPSVLAVPSGKKEDAPVVGADFGSVLALVSAGAANMNALRDRVETFLSGQGAADKLPAMAERIGWSYHGSGRVLDGNGKPVAGAMVKSVNTVGDVEYVAGTAMTGSDGRFTIDRLFPGDSIVRVTASAGDAGTAPAPRNQALTIAWTTPTSQAVTIPDVTIGAGAEVLKLPYENTKTLERTYTIYQYGNGPDLQVLATLSVTATGSLEAMGLKVDAARACTLPSACYTAVLPTDYQQRFTIQASLVGQERVESGPYEWGGKQRRKVATCRYGAPSLVVFKNDTDQYNDLLRYLAIDESTSGSGSFDYSLAVPLPAEPDLLALCSEHGITWPGQKVSLLLQAKLPLDCTLDIYEQTVDPTSGLATEAIVETSVEDLHDVVDVVSTNLVFE